MPAAGSASPEKDEAGQCSGPAMTPCVPVRTRRTERDKSMWRKIGRGFRGKERRIAVAIDATVIESDGCEVPVSVLDVSGSGFRLSANAEFSVGDEVELRVGLTNPVRAAICWTRGLEAGGIFLEPAAQLS